MHTPQSLMSKIEYTLSGRSDASLLTATVDRICRDSRTADAGSIFFCIKGANFDGHDYAAAAYMNGCRLFVVQRELDLPDDTLQIIVQDSRIALSVCSAEFFGHPEKELNIVGITGTKGKTTTALTAYQLLNGAGIKSGYIGSNGVEFDGHFFKTVNTTPESYDLMRYMRLMVDSGVRFLIMEVSSQAIYMNRVYGIEFHTAVFTNLSVDHIGGNEHPTFEHYRDCKRRLFTDFGAKNVVYNADDPYSEYMVSGCGADMISCSLNEKADMNAVNRCKMKGTGRIGTSFSLVHGNGYFPTSVSSPGEFSVYNALLAAAICRLAGADMRDVARLLPSVSIKGRFESVDALPYAAFIIDYAHNGISLSSALTALREYTDGRLICLFGSVGGRTKGRRKELGDAAAALADLSIITADNPDSEPPERVISDIEQSFTDLGKQKGIDYVTFPYRRDAIRFAVSEARRGDVVLLAGKGHEDYQLIGGKEIPFSERAIINEAALEIGELV